jgi:hypothetical protein
MRNASSTSACRFRFGAAPTTATLVKGGSVVAAVVAASDAADVDSHNKKGICMLFFSKSEWNISELYPGANPIKHFWRKFTHSFFKAWPSNFLFLPASIYRLIH